MKTISNSDAVMLHQLCKQFHIEDGGSYRIIANPMSKSSHADSIVKVCNNMITEYPESRNTIFALLTYSTQKWASEARSRLKIDAESEEVMLKDEAALFRQYQGILRQDISPRLSYDFKWKLETSEKLLLCIEEAVRWLEKAPVYGANMAKVIRAAHFSDTEDVSLFLFKKYYEIALFELWHQYGQVIDELVTEMAQPDLLYGQSVYGSSYHNTKRLIKIFPIAGRKLLRHGSPENIWSDRRLQRDSNGLYLLLVYTRAVSLLPSYPDRGEEMYEIIGMLNQGMRIKDISEETKLSPNSIRAIRNQAINLLSFILWGYSTGRILNNLILNQES